MTGALGWTLGCKAVVFAATVFGPWGLLFGAFAAAGAYNEYKKSQNNNRSTNTGNRSSNNSSGRSSSSRSSGSRNSSSRNTNRRNTDTWDD